MLTSAIDAFDGRRYGRLERDSPPVYILIDLTRAFAITRDAFGYPDLRRVRVESRRSGTQKGRRAGGDADSAGRSVCYQIRTNCANWS